MYNKLLQVLLITVTLVLAAPAHAVKDGQTFKDWKVQCQPDKTDALSCHIFQNLVDKDGKNRVLHIAIGYVEGREKPAVIITLPLGLSLVSGVTIQVDERPSERFPYQACFRNGCQAGFPMSQPLFNGFRQGKTAMVTVFDLTQKDIRIPVSLNGFSAAIKAIKPAK